MNEFETVTEHFDRMAQAFATNYSNAPDFKERLTVWERAIEKHITSMPKGSLCLDLGCGDGILSRPVAARGIPTVGIDRSHRMVSLAQQKADEAGVSSWGIYRRGSLPLSADIEACYAGTAGLVLCSSVLEYIADYEEVLTQVLRLLKPGGRLILSVPNRRSVYRVAQRIAQSIFPLRSSYLRHQQHQFEAMRLGASMKLLGYRISDQAFFALPLPRITERIVRRYRGQYLATMILIVAEKPVASHQAL